MVVATFDQVRSMLQNLRSDLLIPGRDGDRAVSLGRPYFPGKC